ncbi:MAG: BolA family transcriptional regulator [Kordiimonadaceae bacterium]|nr:BolA family transcriptional regulator [Kordiimonadaceae bacterium]MBV1900549.1 BolA family transcriptional regulator [Kordiimonadaceae bacterium]
MSEVTKLMEKKLTAALAPTHLEIINDSDSHQGHAGHDGSGDSHFTVIIQSAAFEGKNRVAMQRLVMGALKEELASTIHALSIKASAP